MEELKNWLSSLGYAHEEINLDGEIVRFGEKKECWLWAKQFEFARSRGNRTVVAAVVGNWRTGEKHRYSSASRLPRHESDIINIEIQKKIDADRIERERKHEESAVRAAEKFNSLTWAPETPYTTRKKVGVDPKCRVSGGLLYVPFSDVNGKMWTFQTISGDGTKMLFAGGKKQGNFFTLGEIKDEVMICEGYATGYSLYQKHGKTVIVAVDAGNLLPVSRALREKYPELKITFAADRDESGVGEDRARKAAEVVGGVVVLPPTGFGDFNDADGMLPDEIEPPSGPYPDLDDAGRKRATIENVKELFLRNGVIARYNVINKVEELLIKGESFTMDNRANAALARVYSMASSAELPKDNIKSFICYLADKNQYNPVATWIMSQPWDGVDRLQAFYDTIKSESVKLKEILMRRWLVSAVAAAFSPNGISAHGALVFQGNQNVGKTHWFKKLAPESLNVIQDGVILRVDDKDSVKQTVSYWLVEMGELDATFKKSDIAQLKAFMTKSKDTLRVAYAERESEYPRRTVFFGSVNEKEFLNDTTGNRRFWAINVSEIDFKHNINMQQLWAQVHMLWRNGEPYILSKEELDMLNDNNRKFEAIDPIEEMVTNGFFWDARPEQWFFKTATQCAIELGIKQPSYNDRRGVARALRKMHVQVRETKHTNEFKVPPTRTRGILDFT